MIYPTVIFYATAWRSTVVICNGITDLETQEQDLRVILVPLMWPFYILMRKSIAMGPERDINMVDLFILYQEGYVTYLTTQRPLPLNAHYHSTPTTTQHPPLPLYQPSTSNLNTMSNEASIQLALEDLRLQEVSNYLATAKKYEIN
ncbi:hypothetical protein GX48_08111 [Paracoccidioides brasiliensis]|nr:hypothetical protein GX48_08111 [Paracoccidioides brasiliensis]